MIDQPNPITVEASEADWNSLLKRVREQGGPVRILDHGTPVAELRSLRAPKPLPPIDDSLKATMLVEGHELTTEEDWPENVR